MKVLCINDDFSSSARRDNFQNICSFPKEGWTYTVVETVITRGSVGYILEEVFGGIDNSGNEIKWSADRFVRVTDSIEEEQLKEKICIKTVSE